MRGEERGGMIQRRGGRDQGKGSFRVLLPLGSSLDQCFANLVFYLFSRV